MLPIQTAIFCEKYRFLVQNLSRQRRIAEAIFTFFYFFHFFSRFMPFSVLFRAF